MYVCVCVYIASMAETVAYACKECERNGHRAHPDNVAADKHKLICACIYIYIYIYIYIHTYIYIYTHTY
jgi:hypothetical protein